MPIEIYKKEAAVKSTYWLKTFCSVAQKQLRCWHRTSVEEHTQKHSNHLSKLHGEVSQSFERCKYKSAWKRTVYTRSTDKTIESFLQNLKSPERSFLLLSPKFRSLPERTAQIITYRERGSTSKYMVHKTNFNISQTMDFHTPQFHKVYTLNKTQRSPLFLCRISANVNLQA